MTATTGDACRAGRAELAVAAGLCSIVLFAPLPFGGVLPWARVALFAAALLVFLGAARELRLGHAAPLSWALLALCTLGVLQLAPLPAPAIEALSPRAVELRGMVQGPGAAVAPQPLSLDPGAGCQTLLVLGAATLSFLAASTLRREGSIVAVCGAIVAIGLFVALYGMAQTFSGADRIWAWSKVHFRGRVSGTHVNPNHFAGLMALVIPIALGLALDRPVPAPLRHGLRHRLLPLLDHPGFWQRLLLLFAAAWMGLAATLTLSRGGLAAVLCGLLAFAGTGLLVLRRMRALAAALAVASLVLLWVTGFGLERLAARAHLDVPARPQIWNGTLRLIADYPLAGSGLGSYETVFPRYQISALPAVVDHAHADCLQLAAEAGLPLALAVLICALLFGLRAIWAMIQRRLACGPWLACGLIASLVAVAARTTVDFDLQIPANLLLASVAAGLLAAAARMHGSRCRPAPLVLLLIVAAFWLRPSDSASALEDRVWARQHELRQGLVDRSARSARALAGEAATPELQQALWQAMLAERAPALQAIQSLSLDDLRAAVRARPASPWLNLALATLLAESGRPIEPDELRRHATAAVALFPRSAEIRVGAALALLACDAADRRAADWLEAGLRQAPSLRFEAIRRGLEIGLDAPLLRAMTGRDQQAWHTLAERSLRRGRLELARTALDHLEQIDRQALARATGPSVAFEASVPPGFPPTIACVLLGARHLGHVAVGAVPRRHSFRTHSTPGRLEVVLAAKRHHLRVPPAVLVVDRLQR